MGFEEHDTGLWVPEDANARIERDGPGPDSVILDNRSGLPDEALLEYFEENTAAFGWNSRTNFQSYSGEGSALARSKWRPPTNVIEEIELSRDMAERDDDVAATIDALIATGLGDGYQNQHADEQVQHVFNKIAQDMGLRRVLAELWREWLIAYQFTTVTLFTRASYEIRPEGVSRVLTRNVASPLVGVLPSNQVRVLGDDMFGNADLAFVPSGELGMWLQTFFNASPAKQAAMRRQNPVRATLFVEKVTLPESDDLMNTGLDAYRLNPAMVSRTTAPKGTWPYPRPPMTRNMPLLEAKRLLNVMDHSLLVGGTNLIIVAKKGSKEQPASQIELNNLREVVRRASRSGVLIGDHRVSLEVVTPDLTELLNPEKRRMIGRKLSMALLRVPEFGSDDTGQSVQTFTEILQRVISHDRAIVVDHIEDRVWTKVMARNASVFGGRTDAPDLWMPKVLLQGFQFFNDYLLKLYDRGDLPRKFMVEFGGFSYPGVIAQKKREQDANHDEIFTPPAVPFSSPNQGPGGGPQDNNQGRPRGSGPNNGAPGASPSPQSSPTRPTRVVRQTPGETVRAYWSDEDNQVIRVGEITERILAEYPNCEIGRMTQIETRAAESVETVQDGPVVVVPVNEGVEMDDFRVVRLTEGLAVIVGHRRPDDALMARAICCREPHFDLRLAENLAIRWGFPIPIAQPSESAEDPPVN